MLAHPNRYSQGRAESGRDQCIDRTHAEPGCVRKKWCCDNFKKSWRAGHRRRAIFFARGARMRSSCLEKMYDASSLGNSQSRQAYSISFVCSEDGSGGEFGGWSLGINALPEDSRDAVSQYVMAHRDFDGSAGRWALERADDDTYSISFVSSAHGGDTEFAEFSLGINALPKDKRDDGSQYVMAHSDVCGCDGRWILRQCDDGTHHILFVSSAHGGDKQFSGWFLSVHALPCDARDAGSQFVMAHCQRKCAGKWRLLPV